MGNRVPLSNIRAGAVVTLWSEKRTGPSEEYGVLEAFTETRGAVVLLDAAGDSRPFRGDTEAQIEDYSFPEWLQTRLVERRNQPPDSETRDFRVVYAAGFNLDSCLNTYFRAGWEPVHLSPSQSGAWTIVLRKWRDITIGSDFTGNALRQTTIG